MAAPTRTRSRSRATSRRPVSRAQHGGPSPRLVVLGAAAVIALVLGALAGAVLLRPASSSKAPAAVAVNPAGSPAAEVALPTEDNPGPVRRDGLVPAGFTSGTTGAVAASVAYSKAAVELTTRPEAEVRSATRKMSSAATNADALVAPVATLRTTLAARPDTVQRVVPLGRRIVTPGTTRQTVDVWLAVVSATPSGVQTPAGVVPAPTEVAFVTISTDLVRTGGDWKLAALRVSDGPTPALGNNAPSDPEQLAKDLGSYLPYGYLPPVEVAK